MGALRRDLLFAALMLVVAVAGGSVAFGYAADSSWFPRVLCVFLGVMALLLLVRSLRATDAAGTEIDGQFRGALLVFGGGILYAVAIQFLSFEVTNFLFLAGAMHVLGQRNPYVVVGMSVATMLLIKLLFFVMLDVPRPQGVLY